MGGVCCGAFLFLTEQMASLLIERSWGRCVSCAFQHWFPVVFVSDRIWPLKHFREFFDLFWSIKLFIAAKWSFNKEFSFSSLVSQLQPYPAWILGNFQQIVVLFMTRLLCLPWLICRSVSHYTNLHDWVIKLFQTRWQKCPAFRTSKKCGRADFPLWLCTAHENPLQLLCSPRVVALPPKKYPRHQNPASYIGYTREFLYELPGPTVGHLHLFLKNWQLPDTCPAGGMSMLAIDWVVIQLDYK